MRCAEAVDKLRTFEDRFRALGATALYLCGSTARDTADLASDIDLLIEYDPSTRFNLIDLVTAKHMIEDELGITADFATRDNLHPRYRDEIEREAIQVF